MVSPCRNSTIPTRYSRGGGMRGERGKTDATATGLGLVLSLGGASSCSCWWELARVASLTVAWCVGDHPRSRCAHKKPRGRRHPLGRVPPRGGLWSVQLAGQRMRSARFDVRTAVRPAASNAIMATTTATTGAPVCDSCSTAPALPPLPAALFAPSCRSSPVPGFV